MFVASCRAPYLAYATVVRQEPHLVYVDVEVILVGDHSWQRLQSLQVKRGPEGALRKYLVPRN